MDNRIKKDACITVRCSELDKINIARKAKENGMSVSEFVLSLALTKDRSVKSLRRKSLRSLVRIQETMNGLRDAAEGAGDLLIAGNLEELKSGVMELWRN